MNPDLLQQLRDIHLPAEPGWWPPAVGWWLLALLLAAALIWLTRRLAARWRRFRPARRARALYREISRDLNDGAASPLQYVHRTGELLKRFAIHGSRAPDMASESGEAWLRYLDERYGQPAFSRGPGRCLGTDRFRPDPEPDTGLLDSLIHRFFARECARFWRSARIDRQRFSQRQGAGDEYGLGAGS